MLFTNPVQGVIRPPGSPKVLNSYRVTQPFGCTGVTAEPKLGTCLHFHRGIDVGDGTCGHPVIAARGGTVRYSGKLSNGEQMVILNHGGGWGSSYSHLAVRAVSATQGVVAGTRLGSVGDTGFANGCHLHFAVKSGLPTGWTRADFIPNAFGGRGDSTGKWENPWPLLEQNVLGHPDGAGVNIRATPGTAGVLGPLWGHTNDVGRIVKVDGTDVGATDLFRPWAPPIAGAAYVINGIGGTSWDRLTIGGQVVYVATPLVIRSAT
jgi:murein DD-endopeptidase MepM/ murein hydrolase activator NlpD